MSRRTCTSLLQTSVFLFALFSLRDGQTLTPEARGGSIGGGKKNDVCSTHTCLCRLPEVVDCSRVKLDAVPTVLPKDVHSLYLTGNDLRKLSYSGTSGFRNLFSLRHLFLDENRIAAIDSSAFRDLLRLSSLTLADNQLNRLHPDTFRRLSQLTVLSMRKNRLRTPDETLFSGLVNLQLLNLGENRIDRLTNTTFHMNFQLRVLDLHANRIRHIAADSFSAMPLLQYLILRGNRLLALSEFRFAADVHLELLDVSDCELTRVPGGLPKEIADFRLAENNIRRIGAGDFRSTRSVRLLVLNDNIIDSIDDSALARLRGLYDLHLTRNLVARLPATLPTTLHGLYAGYNNLSVVRAASLARLGRLEHLVLKHNRIDDVDATTFGGLRQLQTLDLSHNNIRRLPTMTFSRNPRVQRLDLSYNPLARLEPRCFRGLAELRILLLSSAGVVPSSTDEDEDKSWTAAADVDPSVFTDVENLQFLDLSNSPRLAAGLLSAVDAGADRRPDATLLAHIAGVTDLNLMHDNLTRLPAALPHRLPQLRSVKLGGNPWRCDADIAWLTRWLRSRAVSFFEAHRIVCVTPPALRGRPIAELSETDLEPPPPLPPPVESIAVLDPPAATPNSNPHSVEIKHQLTKGNKTDSPPHPSPLT